MAKDFEFPFLLQCQKMDKAVQTEPMRHEVQRQQSLVFEAAKSIQSDIADNIQSISLNKPSQEIMCGRNDVLYTIIDGALPCSHVIFNFLHRLFRLTITIVVPGHALDPVHLTPP